ncbi:MAG TPA: triose-phosphate isomerase [Firmicutes bacterium]|jgi:triosephosphate isomerase (TIM)|nr:triose-phosphate isomerase [Bacillota bacterium]
MHHIFVNLKRFEVPRKLGGVCPLDDPRRWIDKVMDETITLGLGRLENLQLTFLLPEALLGNALDRVRHYPAEQTRTIGLGCQGVYREDVTPGGNFGAFTTNRPAAAMRLLGCDWAMIGHSEERKDKLGVIAQYDPDSLTDQTRQNQAKMAVDSLIHAEVISALNAGLNTLICVGETAAEKGNGEFSVQKPRIEEVLRSQLATNLKGVAGFMDKRQIVIGYEPIWAIGPGKTPPGAEYIGFVSAVIQQAVQELYGFTPAVVYGGGLKEENAAMIAGIQTIDGGLVALTRFSGEIGFSPADLKQIIDKAYKAI